MNGQFSIRPSKDLRTNYAQVSALAKQHPVAITVNGKEDTVLLSHEQYLSQQQTIAELQDKLAVYKHLAQSADDVKLGRINALDDTFTSLSAELSELQL